VPEIYAPSLGDFFNYGEEPEDLSKAIRNDIVQVIVSEFFEKDFARFRGAGLEFMENNPDSPLTRILAAARIAEAIGLYNSEVPPERQVVTSQQLIDVISRHDMNIQGHQDIPPATWYVSVQYYLASNIGATQNPVFDILLPYNTTGI
jgi:hypothetical protein